MRTPILARKFCTGAIAAVVLGMTGCAATVKQEGIEQRTATAIGRPAGSFTISNQTEGTGGRIDYSVKTKEGASYQCYMYSATTFQRFMSFGQTPHSDVVCAAGGGAAAVPASCNALNKAAGKC